MNTIQAQWASYEKNVMPDDAGPVQVRETRRAFYGGALAMFSLLHEAGGHSNDAGVAIVDGLRAEVCDFARDVVAGAA